MRILNPRVVPVAAICLGWVTPAGAQSCNSLYAAYVRDIAGLASCADSSAGGFYGGKVQRLCQGGESPNDCADRLYGAKQAGVWQAPELAVRSGAGAFELKFLPACRDGTNNCTGREVRCHDGTRPAVMIDGARGLDPQNNVVDVASDDWVIHMSGLGQPCDALGEHAIPCWEKYASPDVKSEHRRGLSVSHPDFAAPPSSEGGGGILNKDRVGDGFASFNRIKFKRCSMGSSLDHVETDGGGSEPVDIYHYGVNNWLALFHYLTTPEGQNLTLGPDLNDFAAAQKIVLTAGSDATLWLTQVADQLAAELATIAPQASVYVVLDGYFDPMLQNEARYNANPFPGGNMFAPMTYGNPNNQILPPPQSELTGDLGYGAATYQPGGTLRTQWENRGVFLDETCLAAHAADDSPCYDALHVLVDHVTTPWFVVSDLRDPAVRNVPDFPAAESGPHRYAWHQWHFARRVLGQARDIRDFWCTDFEEAPLPNCQNPGLYLILPAQPQHTQITNNDRFFGENGKPRLNHCTGPVKNFHLSIARALRQWILGGQTIAAVDDPTLLAGDHWVTSSTLAPNDCMSLPIPNLNATESPLVLAECGDTVDNDHDGEIDAADQSCPEAVRVAEVIGMGVTGVASQLAPGDACYFSLRLDPPGTPPVDLWRRMLFPTFELDLPASSVAVPGEVFLVIGGANCSFTNPFSVTMHTTEWASLTAAFPAGTYPDPNPTRYYFATDGRIYLDPALTNLYYSPPF